MLFRSGLLDGAHGDVAIFFQAFVYRLRKFAILIGVGGMEIVERNCEVMKIALMLFADALDQLFRCDALALGAQHNGCAVGVVGTDIVDLVTAHALEPHPDIGLHVFHQVADVDAAIGIGQGAGDEYFSFSAHDPCWCNEKAALQHSIVIPW